MVDIGSDHGHLGLELFRLEKVNEVWNVDLSRESLKNSRKIYEKFGFLKYSKFICGNGFKKLENIPDNAVVVIAGLGTVQILKILEDIPSNIRSLILLSHTDYFFIRKWAWLNNWTIHDEIYLEDRGYFYMVMRLIRSAKKRENYSLEDHIFGKRKFREEGGSLFVKFWREKSRRILKIPEEYRTPEEKEVIRFLLRENIISNVKLYENS